MNIQQFAFRPTYLLVFLLLLTGRILWAQVLPQGIPPVRSFSSKVFQAAPQNWDISQSPQHIMYFANNLGVLQFDGTYWQVFPNANKTIIRSVLTTPDGRLYAGGQGELGYYSYSSSRSFMYNSLNHLIPDEFKEFEDVWSIEEMGGNVFFSTGKEVFVFDGTKIQAFTFKDKIEKMQASSGRLFVFIEKKGLYEWQNSLFELKAGPPQTGSLVTGILCLQKDSILISTQRNSPYILIQDGIYSKPDWDFSTLNEKWINKMILLKDGNIALASAQNGVYILNLKDKTLLNFNKDKGLQSNSILSIFQDKTGDLWVTSEHGIDLIQYQSAFRFIYPDGILRGAGYSATIHNKELYLGTNNGLFKFEPNKLTNEYTLVSGTMGQVWGLDTIQGDLYLGHHNGAFKITDKIALGLHSRTGVWRFLPLAKNKILFGHYEGLIACTKQKGAVVSCNELGGFNESSRIMIRDKFENIWVSHPYRGVFRIEFNEDSTSINAIKYNVDKGIKDELNNYIFNINQTPHVTSENGIYRYDHHTDSFISDTTLQNLIQSQSRIQLLYQDNDGDIWYYSAAGLGMLQMAENGIERQYVNIALDVLPEKLLGGFEFATQIEKDKLLFGSEQGFILLDKHSINTEKEYFTRIRSVQLINEKDSTVFAAVDIFGSDSLIIGRFHHSHNKINIQYSCTSYGEELKEYRYKLEGLDPGFSDWSPVSEITFSNLMPGKYKFIVEGRVGHKHPAKEAIIHFEILAPWYNTSWFKIMVSCIVAALILVVFFRQRKGFESEKKEMATIHREVIKEKEQQVEESEKALIHLKNEKLKAEINHKTNELASATMHIVQKQEMINSVQTALKKVLKNHELPPNQRQELQSIIHTLERDAMIDEDWERFTEYFDEVHSHFLTKLKERFPELTPNDHRLCAYLRMNLSTKDIAQLMNISPRGVEGSRYRLRKKLRLDKDANLTDFLQSIGDWEEKKL